MSVAVVSGSAGLIGAAAARLFASKGLDVVGIDNDMRAFFFGPEASTEPNRRRLEAELPGYRHENADIRDVDALQAIFSRCGRRVSVVVHTAAQPSHDWAARSPQTDFSINATGTLNLLELTRIHCPEAVFLHLSTNKVYGDRPNQLPLVERETRWELDESHPYARDGIDESMPVDQCLHSLFGASKLAADLLVQEYGRYFGLRSAVFRGGCLTGPDHAGAELHGFLAYLVHCAVTNRGYTVFGYKGKQVRDNIHASDLVDALWHFFERPRVGEVYNMGGGRHSNCSMLEAIAIAEKLCGRRMHWTYSPESRIGDHQWWISDVGRFRRHFPEWSYRYDLEAIMAELFESQRAGRS